MKNHFQNRLFLIAVCMIALLFGRAVYAQLDIVSSSGDRTSSQAQASWYYWLESSIEGLFSQFKLDKTAWTQYGSDNITWDTANYPSLTKTYHDSAGSTLTFTDCYNGWYSREIQTICFSTPNSCGMTGTGFVTEYTMYNPGGEQDEQIPCSAQTPPESTCPAAAASATCDPQPICHADGNVYDSCSGAQISLCPNGCTNGSCNAACVSHNVCQADGNLHDSCNSATTTVSCKWGCVPDYCLAPHKGVISALSAKPSLVSSGSSSVVKWSVMYVTDCTLTGSNGDKGQSSGDGDFNITTSPITQQTSYELQCTGLDGAVVSDTVKINILPKFKEK